MKKYILPFLPLLALIVGVVTAFGTGGADEPTEPVVLDEEDLMEQVEIWRNQYRRMTPGDGPLVQDVGELPAAWEEFGNRWSSAPAERDLATWLVPFSAERQGDTTVIRDADGTVLWSGTTDFAKPGSTNVTITGALVDEADRPFYDASRWEVFRRLSASQPRLRDGEGGTNGNSTNNSSNMFVSAYSVFTNDFPELHVGLQWTNDVTLDIFAYGALHEAVTNEITYTNDENQVITTNVTHWHSVEPGLLGWANDWKWVGTVSLTNGEETVFVDTNYVQERWKVCFYAAAEAVDTDGDGLNDGVELFETGTSPNNPDDDGDGIPDGLEQRCGADPAISNVWWEVSTTNIWEPWDYFLGCSNSWTLSSNSIHEFHFDIDKPADAAVLRHAWMSGYVDDAIKIDGTPVQWGPDVTLFDHVDVAECIEDVERGDFRVDLFDWPRPGFDGCNEVRLGTADNPFRIEWEWSVPLDVRMEPIWTSVSLPLDNPSGIIQGSNAWFHVDVLPANVVPETNILWTVLGTNLVLTPTNRGSRVQVFAAHEGDGQLQATVEGTQGEFALPPFHVKVVPLTVVTARVGIVVNHDGTTPAVQPEHVWNVIAEANGVLAQAGIQLEALTLFEELDDTGGVWWNLALTNTPAVNSLLGSLPSGNGVEIYFVSTLDKQADGHARGFNKNGGIALAAAATGRTLAHEIGHAARLSDIYVFHTETDQMVGGDVEPERVPMDQGNYLVAPGEPLPMAEVLKRLMMYGFSGQESVKGDLPGDTVYGLGYERHWENGEEIREWFLEDFGVGLRCILQTPHHQ